MRNYMRYTNIEKSDIQFIVRKKESYMVTVGKQDTFEKYFQLNI